MNNKRSHRYTFLTLLLFYLSETIVTSSRDTTSPTIDDELPEQELFTPELAEDEAIRGDIVLKWAVVLLAFLLACTEVGSSTTLVHIKSGQYLAAHWGIPPRTDVFSYTATNRPWVNLSWMYDLLSATLYAVGGATALVLFKATVIGLTFWLMTSISVRNVSSWWTVICATLALFACFPQFTATPQSITFLGIMITLWLLYRWRSTEENQYLYFCLPLIFLWGQFDSQMFLGLTILFMYGLGDLVGDWLNRPSLETTAQRKSLWLVIGLSFVVAMIHPFGWHTLTQPWQMLGVEYPALRARFGMYLPPQMNVLQYYPVAGSFFWSEMKRTDVASLILIVTALITFFLNRKKVDVGEMFIYLGMLGYALLASHFLTMAALVSAVLAGVNAQHWYRNTFRQTYSIEYSEIIFSRGGRAVTVLALAGFAMLGINGGLAGEWGNRIGLDFHPLLRSHFEGMQSDLKKTFDDKPFNFVMSQGDILIWIGKKPFIDSRVQLYCGVGEENLLKQHNLIRHALHPKERDPISGRLLDPLSGKPEVWRKAFNKYKVSYVTPRLFGMPPDYVTYFGLWNSKLWQKQKLGSTTAIFYRSSLIRKGSPLAKYLLKNRTGMVQQAFREDVTKEWSPNRHDWSRPATWQENYLWKPRKRQSASLFEAYHCMEHINLKSFGNIPMSDAAFVATAYWTIRKTNEVLKNDPHNEEAFRLQGMAYKYLGQFEAIHTPFTGGQINSFRRYYQAISALNQAVVINPDNPRTHIQLYDLYQSHQQFELALLELEAYDRLTSNQTLLTPDEKVLKRRLMQERDQLTQQSEEVDLRIEEYLKKDISKVLLAQQLASSGFPLKALMLIEEEAAQLRSDLSAQIFKVRLFFEAGLVEESYSLMQSLIPAIESRDLRNWQELTALLYMAHGEYDLAIPYWEKSANQLKREQAIRLFHSFPLTMMSLPVSQEEQLPWPLTQTAIAPQILGKYPHDIAVAQLNAALCEIEAGHNKLAEKRIRKTLEQYPNQPQRKLLRFYLYLLSGELINEKSPASKIPDNIKMFDTID